MRQLHRPSLSQRTQRFLAARTRDVVASVKPAERAAALWALRRNKAFEEIRDTLQRMATGLERCMYCEDSQGTDIDHFRPKNAYPQHAYDWTNYFLACSHCNSNEKRDQFPLDTSGSALLIDPVLDDPTDHLEFSPSTGKLVPLTAKGVSSRDVFGLDREVLVRGRVDAWVAMQALLVRYDALMTERRWKVANAIKRALSEHPFSSTLVRLVCLSKGAGARLIERDCLMVLQRRPDIATWI